MLGIQITWGLASSSPVFEEECQRQETPLDLHLTLLMREHGIRGHSPKKTHPRLGFLSGGSPGSFPQSPLAPGTTQEAPSTPGNLRGPPRHGRIPQIDLGRWVLGAQATEVAIARVATNANRGVAGIDSRHRPDYQYEFPKEVVSKNQPGKPAKSVFGISEHPPITSTSSNRPTRAELSENESPASRPFSARGLFALLRPGGSHQQNLLLLRERRCRSGTREWLSLLSDLVIYFQGSQSCVDS